MSELIFRQCNKSHFAKSNQHEAQLSLVVRVQTIQGLLRSIVCN
jgi:hypothetical protein